MLTIGVTGGTGCGKTAFLNQIAARGGQIVDCDALYAHMVLEDDALRQDLTAAFGQIFLPDGRLDRKQLAQIVFSDKSRLADLNRIVYHHIGLAVGRLQEACTAPLFAIDAINLLQSGLADLCQVTVAVTAPEEVRLRRIMARDGLTEAEAMMRIRAQEPEAFFRAHCTYTLENGGSDPTEFIYQANQLLDHITKENVL